jgi:hypothetical protein
MKFAFPILTATGEEFKDVKALTALINGEQSGHYLRQSQQMAWRHSYQRQECPLVQG